MMVNFFELRTSRYFYKFEPRQSDLIMVFYQLTRAAPFFVKSMNGYRRGVGKIKRGKF